MLSNDTFFYHTSSCELKKIRIPYFCTNLIFEAVSREDIMHVQGV